MSDNKIQEHLNKMKLIQERILGYLDEEKNDEKSFEELIRNLDNQQIRNRQDLNLILHLLSNLIDSHHQIPDFFKKIEQIFSAYQGDIQRYFTNSFLFNLFINSKAFLFYLFKIKIIKPTKQIVKTICTHKFRKKNYVPYLYNYCLVPRRITYFGTEEINEYTSEQFLNDCETGENNNYICKLIREDSVVEFIKYVSQTNVGLNTEINPTISESNLLLLDNTITIIDYAIFYGAIQIVKYLLLQNVPLNSHHWEFAMYSNNPEIFQLLSDNKVSFPYGNEVNLYKKAIKIHDMKLADYFYDQISVFSESDCENCIITAIKNYNFAYLADNLTDYISKADPKKKENLFKLLCSNKYLFIVESFIQNEWIKIENQT